MADWRYFATRLNGNGTETVLHSDLPLAGVSITDTLSGPQALTASISPETASLVGPDGEPVFEPWSTAVYAEKDGLIRAGTILTDMVASGPSLKLDCIGFTGYAKDMPYLGADYAGVQVDALDAFRTIWTHIQAQQRGNLGLVIDPPKANFKIDSPLLWHSNHDLSSDLQKLAKTATFDYREVHEWVGMTDIIKHRIEVGVPMIGRRREDLRFVVGENVGIIPDVTWEGEDYASDVLVLGAGEGAKMVRGNATRAAETRLRRVSVLDDKRLGLTSTANVVAAQELSFRIGRPDISAIRVIDHPHAVLGSWSIGDEIQIQLPEGWSGDLALWCRVLAHTITPDDENVASLSVARVDRI